MEVEDDVAIVSEQHQRRLKGFELCLGPALLERFAPGRPYHEDIFPRVIRQVAVYRRRDLLVQHRIASVEVVPAREVESSDEVAENMLREADRVGHRNEDDLAQQRIPGFERQESFAQDRRDQHAGRLVGMQRCLDVDLSHGRRPSEMQGSVSWCARPRRRRRQRKHEQGLSSHVVPLKRVCEKKCAQTAPPVLRAKTRPEITDTFRSSRRPTREPRRVSAFEGDSCAAATTSSCRSPRIRAGCIRPAQS